MARSISSLKLPKASVVETVFDDLDEVNVERIKTALTDPRLVTGLDRWELWLLIALSRHVARQKWAAEVVETLLKVDLKRIGEKGSMGHPADASGDVPDCPGWTYQFHGVGCLLTNSADGMEIDFDTDDQGDCCLIDPFFYSGFLLSLPNPALPEKILQRPEVFDRFWHADLKGLEEVGCWISKKVSAKGLEVYMVLKPVIDRLSKISTQPEPKQKLQALYLCLQLGDIVLAADLADSRTLPKELIQEIKDSAIKAKDVRARALKSRLASSRSNYTDLQALAELGPEFAKEEAIKHLLQSPVDGKGTSAIQILAFWQQSDLDLIIEKLINLRAGSIDRTVVNTTEDIPDDNIVGDSQFVDAIAALLFTRKELDTSIRALAYRVLDTVKTASEGKAAFLLYIMDNERGLKALKSALLSGIPLAYFDAAAACCVIDTPETRQLLIATLKNSEKENQHAAACALDGTAAGKNSPELLNWLHAHDGMDGLLEKGSPTVDRSYVDISMRHVLRFNMRDAIDSAIKALEPLAILLPNR